MSNAYDVNYNDLNSGTNTLNKTSEEMNQILEKASKLMSETCEGDIFRGPAANHTFNVWNEINKDATHTSENYVRTANSLEKMNTYYQETDKEVGEKAGGI